MTSIVTVDRCTLFVSKDEGTTSSTSRMWDLQRRGHLLCGANARENNEYKRNHELCHG
jgi:hypothetical protein